MATNSKVVSPSSPVAQEARATRKKRSIVSSETALEAGLVLLLLTILLVQYLPILRSSLSWDDEALHASTSLSLVRGGLNATVLGDFPHTHTLVGFYGPVAFWLGAQAFKLFGFSRLTWRTFAFGGNILLYPAAFLLFRTFGFNRRTSLLALLVLSLSMEESFGATTGGRADAWALGGVLFAVAIALRAYSSPRQVWTWITSGAIAGVFLACTPRAWALWLAASVVLFAAGCLDAQRRRTVPRQVAWANVTALASTTLVLRPWGLTPWGFFRAVARGSRNDKLNSSPLLGGSWGFHGTKTQVVFYVVLIVLIASMALHRRLMQACSAQAVLFVCIACANAGVEILLLSRSFNTSFFWGPLLLLGATALAFSMHRQLAGPGSFGYLCIAGVFASLLAFMVALRIARVAQAVLAEERDDSSQLRALIERNIPAGSVVYGPVGVYFFAIEQHGASYRYAHEETTPGLASIPDVILTPSPLLPTLCRSSGYVLWPTDGDVPAMDENLRAQIERTVAVLPETPRTHGKLKRILGAIPGGNVGFDASGAVLYKLKQPSPRECRSR